MKTYSYKITDTKSGIFAKVDLEEGTFNLEIRQLPYNRIDGNRRTFEVIGTYPRENYAITYEAGRLFILKKGGSYTVGQEVEHSTFGKGIINEITNNALAVTFGEEKKYIMKSIAINFLK